MRDIARDPTLPAAGRGPLDHADDEPGRRGGGHAPQRAPGADLNRDHIVLEQPETQALHRVVRRVRPAPRGGLPRVHPRLRGASARAAGWPGPTSRWTALEQPALRRRRSSPPRRAGSTRRRAPRRRPGTRSCATGWASLPPDERAAPLGARHRQRPERGRDVRRALLHHRGGGVRRRRPRPADLGNRVDAYLVLLLALPRRRHATARRTSRRRGAPAGGRCPRSSRRNYLWVNPGMTVTEFPVVEIATGRDVQDPDAEHDDRDGRQGRRPDAARLRGRSRRAAATFRPLLERHGIPFETLAAPRTVRAEAATLVRDRGRFRRASTAGTGAARSSGAGGARRRELRAGQPVGPARGRGRGAGRARARAGRALRRLPVPAVPEALSTRASRCPSCAWCVRLAPWRSGDATVGSFLSASWPRSSVAGGAAGQGATPPPSVADDFVSAGSAARLRRPARRRARSDRGRRRSRAHIRFLASPALEGRGLGARGPRRRRRVRRRCAGARRDPAARRELLPAGAAARDHGLRRRAGTIERARGDGGAPEPVVPRGGGLPASPRPRRRRSTAPVVFAGFGIREAELGRDDYRGLDVRGKAVLVLGGVPAGAAWRQPELVARYGADEPGDRWAAKRGGGARRRRRRRPRRRRRGLVAKDARRTPAAVLPALRAADRGAAAGARVTPAVADALLAAPAWTSIPRAPRSRHGAARTLRDHPRQRERSGRVGAATSSASSPAPTRSCATRRW